MELRQGSLSAAGIIGSLASGGRLAERMSKIEIGPGSLHICASVIAQGLALEPSLVQPMMRKGEITRSPSWANATIRFAMTSFAISRPPLRSVWQAFSNAAPIARMLSGPNTESRPREKAMPTGLLRWFCLAYFAPNRCRDQPQKRPVVQSHGITLSFHREMADSSREFVGPDVTAAVSFESYPRFIEGGFQDYEGLGIKRSTADSKHVPSPRSRLLGNNVSWSLPQKVVEFLELTSLRAEHVELELRGPSRLL